MSLATAATLAAAAAQPVAQMGRQAPSSAAGLLSGLFALLLVLGLILGLAWLLRRLPGGGLRQAEGLRVVASAQLGVKERAVVLDVNGEQLLLGVSPGGVSLLHALPAPLPEPPVQKLPSLKELPDFAQLLAKRLRKD